MAWASQKQYAILINNEDGKCLSSKLSNMERKALRKAIQDFLKE